jgi:nitronate monooxygenase
MQVSSDIVLGPRVRLRHPVVAAPMAGVTTPELAAAVTEAGGLGVLAFATIEVEKMRDEMARARQISPGPIGVNFFANAAPEPDVGRERGAAAAIAPLYRELGLDSLPTPVRPGPGFDEGRFELLLELDPDLVSFHFGLPSSEVVERLAAKGTTVATTATNISEARAAESAGADVVIAQGAEAGGHRGTLDPESEPIGTLALVPQVADAVSVPVLAAGGIGDGRGLAAALSLGAAAAQIGTAFIPCSESAADDVYRRAVLSTAGEDTTMTSSFSGRPARGRSNRLTSVLEGAEVAPFPVQRQLSGPLAKGGLEYRALWMGQAGSLARAEPAAAIVERIVCQAQGVARGVADRWRES